MPVDVVLLHQGREVPGSPDLTEINEGTTYQFANSTTRETFRATPAAYAAVEGGACGRMGALAGVGDARRYLLHEGRLYFFASDACRDTFAQAPVRFIAKPDAPPTGTPESRSAGMAAVDRWVAWSGGADAIRSTRTIARRATPPTSPSSPDWSNEEVVEFDFAAPSPCILSVSTWTQQPASQGESPKVHRYEMACCNGQGWTRRGEDARETLASSRTAAFLHLHAHDPAFLLRARFSPGFVAVLEGEESLDGRTADCVAVSFAGATTRLLIDRSTGELLAARYRDRAPSLAVADVSVRYLAHTSSGGVRLPSEWQTTYATLDAQGLPQPSPSAAPKASPPVQITVAR